MTAPNLHIVKPTDIDSQITAAAVPAVVVDRLASLRERKGSVTVLPPGDGRFNDLANAERFIAEFGDDLRYCVESDKWMIYSGRHWQVDNEFFVMEYARDFAKRELDAAIPSGNKMRVKNADRMNHRTGFNAMLDMAKQMRAASISMFDAESTHYLLNCANGTLDLTTGELRKHRSDDFITRVISAEYHPEAECPQYDRFLQDIQPDPEIRGFLQRSIGYSLLGDIHDPSFWILYGIGNNGKSVFTKTFIDLLGPYASGMQAESLMDSKRTAGAASEDIARLKAKRYILVSESNEGEYINAAQIKALSAGDVVTARELFKASFDFAFTGKLWIATNHRPAVTDFSKGFWRRVKLVPFAQDIPDAKLIDKTELHARFRREASGLLSWAVRGCMQYMNGRTLRTPEVIQREIDQYKFEQDSIAQFLAECCQTVDQGREIAAKNDVYFTEADFQVKNPDLYEAYVKYCKHNGEFPRKQRRFTQNLQERGFIQQRSASRYWEGLRLLET